MCQLFPSEEMRQPVALVSWSVNVTEVWLRRPENEKKEPLIHWFIHSRPEQLGVACAALKSLVFPTWRTIYLEVIVEKDPLSHNMT